MSSRIRILSSWVVVCAVASTASAAEPVRWADVVQRLDENPRFMEACARAQAAAAGVKAASQVPNPQFEVTGGEGRSQDGLQRRGEWSVSLAIPLDWLGTQGPRVDGARSAAVAAEAESAAVRREALLQLRRLFVTAAYEQDVSASMATQLAQTEELARLVRRRVESGEGRPTELPRVEVEVERTRGALEQAQARTEGLREQLSLWMGRPVIRVDAEPSSETELPPLGDVQARAREDNPLVLAARARIASAQAALQVEKNQRIPAVSVGGYALSELDRKAAGGAIGISAPIWNWNGGKIEQAESNELAEESRLAVAKIEAAGAATQAWWMCRQGQAATRRYRDAILPRAEQTARTLERSFQLGEASLLEVLDARRVLLEARRDALATWLERETDCATLHYLFAGDFR
jgi:cobalt-zinc-cadmium efflux system outer membrane protein